MICWKLLSNKNQTIHNNQQKSWLKGDTKKENPKWTTNKTRNTTIPCYSQVKSSSTQPAELLKDIETEASNSDAENIKNCDIINEAVENYLTVVISEVLTRKKRR